MEKEKLKDKDYAKELVGIIRKDLQENNKKELIETVSDYHENDIAEALTRLTVDERKKLYPILGVERIAEIFAYLDEDEQKFLKELSIDNIAKVVSEMDSDDAVDILENMEQSTKEEIVKRLDKDAGEDVRMLLSYDEDEIGSCMTTNYICIHEDLNIRQAMSELVRQAGENDNISTIYVVDKNDLFCGAIDLKDLIIARDYENLDDLIIRSYPYVLDHENISDCLDQIREYAEDSIPVLTQEGKIVGIITSSDIIEVVDDEMGDDYAKLVGLTAEEDLREKTLESMKKRLPWLIILLFLGMAVSSVVGAFENVVAVLPIVICFQSLILDMAGNVGTQSLAVTIRVLMDENLTGKQKFLLVMKEMKIGLLNGVFLGIMAFLILGLYISYFKHYDLPHAFLISGCVGIALIVSMVISSFVGTVIPMFFHKINFGTNSNKSNITIRRDFFTNFMNHLITTPNQ